MAGARLSLPPDVVEKLLKAAGDYGRHRLRNSLLIRLMYGHALRLVETVDLQWGQLDLRKGLIRVERRRSGRQTIRNLSGTEIRLLKKLRGLSRKVGRKDPVFVSASGSALTPDAVRKMIAAAADEAGLKRVVPRMLRRSAGTNVGAKTNDLNAVQALLGVNLRASAIPMLPDRAPEQQADPWS